MESNMAMLNTNLDTRTFTIGVSPIVMFCMLILFCVQRAYANPQVLQESVIQAKDFVVIVRESELVDKTRERTFLRDGRVLYRSNTIYQDGKLKVRISAGHPSQLGIVIATRGRIAVQTLDEIPLWAEMLNVPLCLPELTAEFVQAHWDVLTVNGAPLKCGAPIIKAKKVAPLQWQRLPDNADGTRVVELQPGSLGMRFFLRPTRFVFSADGSLLLSQEGQFESIPKAEGRATYLMGKVRYSSPRSIAVWPKAKFYGG
jgi:hypothetical protein